MEQVLQQFYLDGTPVSCEPFGNGHINRTFRVTCSSGRVYTLQRINRVAFRHPEELIENIDAVSRFIAKKNTGLEMIRLCTARGGRKYAVDAQGEFWRAYDYISGGLSLEAPRDCNDFYQAAVAFGKFQQALADFPAVTLHETIPRFHDTEDRLCQLRASVEADACGRVREAGPELAFISAREQELGTLCRMLRSGALPLRVTHNDTKLNNVLLDEKTGLARSVLDLDTVMPGLSAYDFGDAVRFGASSAAEDETDLSKVFLRLDLYRAFLEGYLDACGHALSCGFRRTWKRNGRRCSRSCWKRPAPAAGHNLPIAISSQKIPLRRFPTPEGALFVDSTPQRGICEDCPESTWVVQLSGRRFPGEEKRQTKSPHSHQPCGQKNSSIDSR